MHNNWQLQDSSRQNPLAQREDAQRHLKRFANFSRVPSLIHSQGETVFTEIHKVQEKENVKGEGEGRLWCVADETSAPPFFGGIIQSDSVGDRQIRSDGCSDTNIKGGKIKRERERESERDTDLEVVPLLSSSGVVQPNFEVAQDREEAGPCSQTQTGTFLGHKRPTGKKKKDGVLRLKGGAICMDNYLCSKDRQGKRNHRSMCASRDFSLCVMRTFN